MTGERKQEESQKKRQEERQEESQKKRQEERKR